MTPWTEAAYCVGHALGPLATDIEPPPFPDELLNLRNLRLLPDVVAGFLGAVAVAAVAYGLVSSARRRRSEFAVLRAMGMTRRNARSIVHAQSTAMALLAVVVGIPAGLIVGRQGWHLITEHVPLSDVTPVALVALLLIAPATVLVTNAVALWPSRQVSRAAVATESLRAEQTARTNVCGMPRISDGPVGGSAGSGPMSNCPHGAHGRPGRGRPADDTRTCVSPV